MKNGNVLTFAQVGIAATLVFFPSRHFGEKKAHAVSLSFTFSDERKWYVYMNKT